VAITGCPACGARGNIFDVRATDAREFATAGELTAAVAEGLRSTSSVMLPV
jgi:hypothetical protein